MTQLSQPWDGILQGDAGPYDAERWQLMYKDMVGSFMADRAGAVLPNSGLSGTQPLYVRQSSPTGRTVNVTPGSALIQGVFYNSDDEEVIDVPTNTSGNPRTDTLVLRLDREAQTVRLALVTGSPGITPIPFPLVQTELIWEIRLAYISVANGFATLTDSNISNAIYKTRGEVPTGTVVATASAVVPEGWLIAAGQAVSREEYRALFVAIGTNYGIGNGTTTFNLPDLRGRFTLGRDDMNGQAAGRVASATTLGATGGAAAVTLTTAQIPAHTHPSSWSQHLVQSSVDDGADENDLRMGKLAAGGGETTGINSGGGGSHENMPPYAAFHYLIKT